MIRSVGCLITHWFCLIAPQVKENEQIKFIFEYYEKKRLKELQTDFLRMHKK